MNRDQIEAVCLKADKFSTTNISDALDALGFKSGVCGILPFVNNKKIFGPAVTLRITAFGPEPSKSHLGIDAITVSQKGDIIVIDNGGREDVSCWGEILSYGAEQKGIKGVVIEEPSGMWTTLKILILLYMQELSFLLQPGNGLWGWKQTL